MDSLIKDFQDHLTNEELASLTEDSHHSPKASMLAQAVSKGFYADSVYREATFCIMVKRIYSMGSARKVQMLIKDHKPPQPIVFSIGDRYEEVCATCT